MKLLRKQIGRLPVGIWLALIALILIVLAWVMQAYSLLNWEGAVKLGLQNSSFNGDIDELAWATKERGEAIADLVWPMPLTLLALFGILKNRFIGFIASMMTFAICIYFPLFYIFQIWENHPETVLGALILWGIPSLLGIVGLWVNRHLYLPEANH